MKNTEFPVVSHLIPNFYTCIKEIKKNLICTFNYNFIYNGGPEYLNNVFKITKNKTRNELNSVILSVAKVSHTRDEHIFSHSAFKLWNSIPVEIRSNDISNKFRNELKEYFLSLQEIT